MKGENGYFYLNLANAWPKFEIANLHNLEITLNGSLALRHVMDGVDEPFLSRGSFLGGPYNALNSPTPWYRLQAYMEPLSPDTHLELFTLTAETGNAPYFPQSDDPFPELAGWHRGPRDVTDILIPNKPEKLLWVGGLFASDGESSPNIRQMRVDYGRDTYVQHLPAIYRKDPSQLDFLERYFSLHESLLGGLETTISDLPLLFDPQVSPDYDYPSWLSWLTGWLAFDRNAIWSESQTRQYLGEAFSLYGQRGTVEGIRRYLKMYAGVEARIEEPSLTSSIWSLGETSTLGFSTMLAPAHLQGAVVGTSATLDQSHMSRGDDFGSVLFEDVAHRFCVQVYCAELARPRALDDVQLILEQERPAHTIPHLCVIEPRMRVGAQARVGIDAIVAQGPPLAQMGMVLGTGALAGEAPLCKPEEENEDGSHNG